jgi:hypothetical protein
MALPCDVGGSCLLGKDVVCYFGSSSTLSVSEI